MQNFHEKARQIWVLILASLASFMVSLDALVVATSLTTIHRDLGVSIANLEWTVNAYTLSFAVLLFRSRAFSAGNAATFLQATSLIGVVFFLAQFFQVAQGNGPLGAGLRLLPLTATLFVVAAPGLPYAELIAPLIIAGCGASFSLPTMQNAVINAVKAGDIGKASGAFSMFRQLGGAFGVACLAAVFAATGNLGTAEAFSSGFASALFVAAALSLLGAIAGLVLPGRQVKAMEPAARKTAALHEEALSR